MEDTTLTPTSTTNETVATPTPAVEPSTPQQASREALYAKYYSQDQPAPTPTPVVDSGVVDGVAGGEASTTAQVEPTPPSPTPTPDVNAALLAKIELLQQEIQGLKPQTPPPTPTSTPVAEMDVDEKFLALMAEGKTKEAVALLRQSAAQEALKASTSQVTQEVEERLQVQSNIRTFVDNLRSENPDLLPLEDMISAKAQARIAFAQQQHVASGKQWTYADLEREYKSAVNAEMEVAKKFVQQIRGAGKQEALTTKQVVLSSTPVAPNAVTSHRPDNPPAPTQPESPQDYLAKRMALNFSRRGVNA